MLTKPQPPGIHLPKAWRSCVKSAVLHAIALAHYAIVYACARAADSINARVQLVDKQFIPGTMILTHFKLELVPTELVGKNVPELHPDHLITMK
jgi:hypothetical protein